jgi:hypothetical protein
VFNGLQQSLKCRGMRGGSIDQRGKGRVTRPDTSDGRVVAARDDGLSQAATGTGDKGDSNGQVLKMSGLVVSGHGVLLAGPAPAGPHHPRRNGTPKQGTSSKSS